MFSFHPADKTAMEAFKPQRATVADLLRAAGSTTTAAATPAPSLLSSMNATNLAARALLASSLTLQQKAYVASRMGALQVDPLGQQQREALAKLQAGRRLIEQAKQSLTLDAALRAQVTATTTVNNLAATAALAKPALAQPQQATLMQQQQQLPTKAPAATKPKFDPKKVTAQQDSKGNFPVKLHQMLSDLEKIPGGSDIASFLPHGRAFAIHKPREFVRHIMPKYFKMGRFSSFQRQLNLYDYVRITEGVDKGAYSHPMFLYGQQQLTLSMKRNKIKGVKKAKEAAAAAKARLEEASVSSSSHDAEGGDDESEA